MFYQSSLLVFPYSFARQPQDQSSRATNAPYFSFIYFNISSFLRRESSSSAFSSLCCFSYCSNRSSCFYAQTNFSLSKLAISLVSFAFLCKALHYACSFSWSSLPSCIFILIWQLFFLIQKSSSDSLSLSNGRQQMWLAPWTATTNLSNSSVIWMMHSGRPVRQLQTCRTELNKCLSSCGTSSTSAKQISLWGEERLVCSMRSTPSWKAIRTKLLRMMKFPLSFFVVSMAGCQRRRSVCGRWLIKREVLGSSLGALLIYGNAPFGLSAPVVLLDELDGALVDVDRREVVHVVVFLPVHSAPLSPFQRRGMLGDGRQLDRARGVALGDEDLAHLRFREVSVALLIGVRDCAFGGLLGGRFVGEDFEVGEGLIVLRLLDEVFVVVAESVAMINLLALIHNFIAGSAMQK